MSQRLVINWLIIPTTLVFILAISLLTGASLGLALALMTIIGPISAAGILRYQQTHDHRRRPQLLSPARSLIQLYGPDRLYDYAQDHGPVPVTVNYRYRIDWAVNQMVVVRVLSALAGVRHYADDEY